MGRFPNCRYVGSPHRQIEEVGGIADAQGPNVLHMEHREAIRASRQRALTRSNGVDGVRLREGCVCAVQGVANFEIFVNSPRLFVLIKIFNIRKLLT